MEKVKKLQKKAELQVFHTPLTKRKHDSDVQILRRSSVVNSFKSAESCLYYISLFLSVLAQKTSLKNPTVPQAVEFCEVSERLDML